jgi:hypothetical protein
MKFFIDLINEEPVKSNGWSSVVDDKQMGIFKKAVDDNPVIMIKSRFIVDGYTKEQVFEAIANISIRREWDKIFNEFKVVESDGDGSEILYMSIKVTPPPNP